MCVCLKLEKSKKKKRKEKVSSPQMPVIYRKTSTDSLEVVITSPPAITTITTNMVELKICNILE